MADEPTAKDLVQRAEAIAARVRARRVAQHRDFTEPGHAPVLFDPEPKPEGSRRVA